MSVDDQLPPFVQDERPTLRAVSSHPAWHDAPPIGDDECRSSPPIGGAEPSTKPKKNGRERALVVGRVLTPEEFVARALSNGSILTAIQIVAGEARHDVLGKRKLEFNDMTQEICLDRKPICDADETNVRAEIERMYPGNKEGRGLRISKADVHDAIVTVAMRRKFHPVCEYLGSLKWDGKQRIANLVEQLGAEDSDINRALLTRFMVGAVARAYKPGCKMDTVLILVGRQGCHKSTFFQVLCGAEWFVDSDVDLHRKDVFMVLHSSWFFEWAELSVIRRSPSEAVKAFLSSVTDTYVPPYGRNTVKIPRGNVFVGSTNNDEFLTDVTGSRRFWPMRTGITRPDIDLKFVATNRDQLWAEAVAMYHAGDQWWLTDEETNEIASKHQEHETSDEWEDRVVAWADKRTVDFTTGQILEDREALAMAPGTWKHSDGLRVVSILKRAGYTLGPKKPRIARRWLARSGVPGAE